MTKRKPMTNEAFVRDLMRYSDHGALMQLFVIDALMKAADRVSRADPAQVGGGLISGKAWVGVAQELKRRLDANYGCSELPRRVLRIAATDDKTLAGGNGVEPRWDVVSDATRDAELADEFSGKWNRNGYTHQWPFLAEPRATYPARERFILLRDLPN